MGIIQTIALIIFIILGSMSLIYLGFDFGYDECKKEATEQFNSIFEQGLRE